MKTHKLRIGRHEVQFEELDLTAVHSPREARVSKGNARRVLGGVLESFQVRPEGLASDDAAIMETAGWVFTATAAPASAGFRRRVLLDSSGAVSIDTGRVTVAMPPDMTREQVREELQRRRLVVTRALPLGPNIFEARVAPDEPTLETVSELQAEGLFEFIEPELLENLGPRWRPTGSDYSRQWQHQNANCEPAWDVTRGLRSDNGRPIRIAVVDNGFELTHPELRSGLSGGGYFKDDPTFDWTFVPRGTGSFPARPHGTFCAGMAVARANGPRGCGSAPEAAFIPVACMRDQVGTQATLAEALVYAALPHTVDPSATPEEGADVISCSLGSPGATWRITEALSRAIGRVVTEGRGGLGSVLVWAAGNGEFDIALDEVCSDPRVVSVARSKADDTVDTVAYGDGLDLVAPGVDVFSTTNGGTWTMDTGCSFAAPLVAGIVGLLLARHPTLTRDQAVDRILATCAKVGGVTYDAKGRHSRYGHGRIDAGALVR